MPGAVGGTTRSVLKVDVHREEGLPRGIPERARAKSSQESSRKVGGTDPSNSFCLTQLRIRETFSGDLGITNG